MPATRNLQPSNSRLRTSLEVLRTAHRRHRGASWSRRMPAATFRRRSLMLSSALCSRPRSAGSCQGA
eukprot:2560940-Prymnesium_polylepis.1